MKKILFVFAICSSVLIRAQVPAADTTKNVKITVTENGETYTIELPDLQSLDSLGNLEALKNLEYIEADTSKDSTSIGIGKWKLIVEEKGDGSDDVNVTIQNSDKDKPEEIDVKDRNIDNFETDWGLFSIGYNTYLNADNNVNIPAPYADLENLQTWGSFDVNVGIIQQRFNIANGYLNFNYGFNLEWHNYTYRDNFTILPNKDTLTLVNESTDFKKNKFATNYFTLPLSLGFETKPWDTERSFRMGFGYNPGILLKGKTKQKDDNGTQKVKDNFNLAKFRHEINITIGYGNFNLYASYDVNSMFTADEGPELHPFSVGIIVRRGFSE